MGPVLLSGDAVHFIENHDFEGVPGFNFDRAQTPRVDPAHQADPKRT